MSEFISPAQILSEVQDIHYEPNDFEDGDIADRIWGSDYYLLQEVPMEMLDPDQWETENWRVEKIALEIIDSKFEYPPIVVRLDHNMYEIIDGTHRVKALLWLGVVVVKAYVGQRGGE